MKIRTSYVSNSSSTSYIVYVRNREAEILLPGHANGISFDMLLKAIQSCSESCSDCTMVERYGIADILDEYLEWNSREDNPEFVDRLDELSAAGGDDDVYELQIAYGDQLYRLLLCEFIHMGAVELLSSDHDDKTASCICRNNNKWIDS